jgi:hypothetical protein
MFFLGMIFTMSDWTAGYIADIGYTFGYYPDLNPLAVKLAFLFSGLVCPKFSSACELGFGQGISVNIHAAGSRIQWYGTDFNPSHAAFAQDLAAISGAEPKLYDDSFEIFCSRDDLPNFDFIGLHGIWSWVSEENQAIIVDFLRRKLNVGGVLYISYNTQPGWSAMAPVRHLLSEYAEVMAAPGRGILSRVNTAFDFVNTLLEVNPSFLKANPSIVDKFKRVKGQNQRYLAHEYFNHSWRPNYFAEMVKFLEPAKLSFVCSASYSDHINALNLTLEQQNFLKEIPDDDFRESVRDFIVNRQFRRDYWVKGARKISAQEQLKELRKTRILLVANKDDVSSKVKSSLLGVNIQESIFTPLMAALAKHQIFSLSELEILLQEDKVSMRSLVQAVMILISEGYVAIAQDEELVNNSRERTVKFNQHILDGTEDSDDINFIVSPVTGSGIHVNRFERLFIKYIKLGISDPNEWSEKAWALLSFYNQRFLKDGKALESDEDNLAEMLRRANEFSIKRMQIMKALEII